jgi:cGMP-specific 3',5'-cyclic phosphodiesterase
VDVFIAWYLVKHKDNFVFTFTVQLYFCGLEVFIVSYLCARPVATSLRRKQLDMMDESELFMELIRDVANELDIDVLCHKILVNVGLLTHADRGSLFLARGPRDSRYLVAKLFDVTVDTGKNDNHLP